MYKDNCHIVCDSEKLLVGQIHDSGHTYIGLGNFESLGASIGVSIDSRDTKIPKLRGVRIVGGQGILLDGTGIKVAVGGSGLVQKMQVWADLT